MIISTVVSTNSHIFLWYFLVVFIIYHFFKVDDHGQIMVEHLMLRTGFDIDQIWLLNTQALWTHQLQTAHSILELRVNVGEQTWLILLDHRLTKSSTPLPSPSILQTHGISHWGNLGKKMKKIKKKSIFTTRKPF